MSESEFADLKKRLDNLESKMGATTVKVKRTREKSEYNIFMGEYMKKNKDPKKVHADLFKEAVQAWNKQKK